MLLTSLNISTSQLSSGTEVDTDELTLLCERKLGLKILLKFLVTYETGRVVVTHCLGVTEGLQYGVGLNDLILKGSLWQEFSV